MALPDEETFVRQVGKTMRRLCERKGLSVEEVERRVEAAAKDESRHMVGEILRGFRRRSGLSLEQVARRMGKEPSASSEIASWERDESSLSFYDLVLYMEIVDATFGELEGLWRVREKHVH